MADFQQNFLASLQGGLNIGQQVRGIQNRNQLSQLASQAYGATTPEQQQSLLTNMAAIDPASAQAQQKSFASDEERRNTTMVNMAKLLTSAPEQARPGLYQRMVPTLSQYGLTDLPQQYDAQTAPIIDQAAQSLVQAYSGGAGGAGGTLQSQRVLEDGSILNTYRDGRTENTGLKADRRQWFRDQPGFEPEIINADGSTTQIGAAGPRSPQGQGVSVGQGSGAVRLDIEGISAAQQQRMAQTVSFMQQAGYPEEEIAGFLQSQMPAAVPGAPAAGSMVQAQSRARPSAAQEAQATEVARQQVQLAALPTRLELENNAALNRASGESQVKAQAEQAATGRTNNNAARVYESGMSGVYQGMQGTSTGPIVGRLPALTSEQQIAQGSVAAMAPVLKQMFRAAGEGAFTDKDQDLLLQMVPNRTDTPEAREAKMANVDNIVRAKLNMGPPKVARNPQTGELLYLRFGQWVKK